MCSSMIPEIWVTLLHVRNFRFLIQCLVGLDLSSLFLIIQGLKWHKTFGFREASPTNPCGQAMPLECPAQGQGMVGSLGGTEMGVWQQDKSEQQGGKLPASLLTSLHFYCLEKLHKTHFNFYFCCYFFFFFDTWRTTCYFN